MNWSIRRLGPEDGAHYGEIRLEALKQAPESFGEAYEDNLDRPATYWREILAGERAFFGAFGDGRIVGSANFVRAHGRKITHRGYLLGLYVSAEWRGTGCARALVDTIVDFARGEVVQLHLAVATNNLAARRLYEKAGFVSYGTEPRGLLVGETYVDEELMVKFLDKDEANE